VTGTDEGQSNRALQPARKVRREGRRWAEMAHGLGYSDLSPSTTTGYIAYSHVEAAAVRSLKLGA
jgi:hypothetical protein